MFLKDSFPSLRDAHINFGKAEFDSLAKELESRDRFKNVSCYANNIRCNVRSFEQTYKRVNHILISGYDMTDMLASVTVISKALSDNFDIPLTRRIENAENEDYVISESDFFGLNGSSRSENEAGGVSDDEYDKYFGDEDDEDDEDEEYEEDDEAEEYEEAEEYYDDGFDDKYGFEDFECCLPEYELYEKPDNEADDEADNEADEADIHCDEKLPIDIMYFVMMAENASSVKKNVDIIDRYGNRIIFVLVKKDPNHMRLDNMQADGCKVTAESMFFDHIDIPADSTEYLAGVIEKQFEENHLSYASVKPYIEKFAAAENVYDEYTAYKAARYVISKHYENSPPTDCTLKAEDFPNLIIHDKTNLPCCASAQKLIGVKKQLDTVRRQVRCMKYDKMRMNKIRFSPVGTAYNMAFTGPPGTAKTTVARMFADMLAKEGFISAGNFTECRKSDIVGGYVGHTARKCDSLFSDLAEKGGGVLLFDEIYTLSEKDAQSQFDIEAINCIVQNIENYRSSVYCIFAGYEDKMEAFFESNPGMASRIGIRVKFDGYDNSTLCDIFGSFLEQEKYVLSENCDDILYDCFDEMRNRQGCNFGNAREARNLFDNVKRVMAERVDTNAALEDDFTFVFRNDVKKAIDMSIEALCTATLHCDSEGNDEKDIQPEENLHRCGFIL